MGRAPLTVPEGGTRREHPDRQFASPSTAAATGPVRSAL